MRLLRRELAVGRRKRRDRGQQGTVEEPDVDLAYLATHGIPQRPDGVSAVGEARRTGKGATAVAVGRHQMRAAEARELHAVLENAQHAVIVLEGGGILAADVAAVDESVERGGRAALADVLIGQPVDELKQLHSELDVADPARAELELERDFVGRNVLRDAFAHALHAVHEVVPRGAGPDLLADGVDVGLAERLVPASGRAFSSA